MFGKMSPKLSGPSQQIGKDFQTLCRLCLKKTSLKIDIFHEGLQRDIPRKILNCVSLIVTEDDSLPKFVCMPCIDRLDNFQDFRDMCHESENLLTNYILLAEECNQKEQSCKSSSASPSAPCVKPGSNQKLEFSESCSSSPHEPTPDFVSCSIKTEPRDVPPPEETVGSTWQQIPSMAVKSEPMEEQMRVDVCTSSSDHLVQTGARASATGLEGSVHFDSTRDNPQFGVSAFEDSDGDIVPEIVKTTELRSQSEEPAAKEERFALKDMMADDTKVQEVTGNKDSSHHGRSILELNRNFHTATSEPTTQPQCSIEFTEVDSVMKESGNKRKSTTSGESASTSTRLVVCNVCEKVFDCKARLQIHMRVHSGEKPYVCATCNKAFTQKGNLDMHSRIHTGLKPFVCPVCDSSFRQQTSLMRHLRIHVQKPYMCHLCSNGFYSEQELIAHLLLPHTS